MKSTVIASALAFLIAASVFSMAPFQQQQAAAQESPVLIERGRAHEIIANPDGSRTFKTGGEVPVWIYDQSQSKYVPHIVRFVNSTYTEVQSGLVGVKVGKYDAIITDSNMTKDLAYERWLPNVDGAIIEKFWIDRTVTENATGVFITNIYQATVGSVTVTAYITYAIYDGQPLVRIVKIEGLPQALVSKLKFDREWRALDGDALEIDGVRDSISSTLKTSVQDGTGQYVRVLKNGTFVMQELLQRAKDHIIKVDYDSNRVVFTYGGWTDANNVVLVDDLFSENNPSEDGYIQSTGTGTSCPSSTFNEFPAATTILVGTTSSVDASGCFRAYFEYDITSIPDGSDVSDVVFKFDEAGETGSGQNCDFTEINAQPTASSAGTIYADIGDGTVFVDASTVCTTTGNNKSVDLGTSADSDVEAQLTSNWWAVGLKLDNEGRSGSETSITIEASESGTATPSPTLEVTYTATATVPINIVARTGSDTLETAGKSITVSCTGGGGTHDGNAQVQNFSCDPSVTVTLTLPTANSTHRWTWGDGTTAAKSFAACASGTCTQRNYTDVTQQFFVQVRISEEHQGTIFAPMPDATFTSTITDANGTQTAATLVSDDSQDDFAVIDAMWISQGTVSWSGVQWRDLNVRPAGSDTLASYGTGKFDIDVFSKHVGYEGERHFRLACNGITTDITGVTFDNAAATIEFIATATGTNNCKVEFLTNIYDDVRDVQVGGSSVTWSVAKTGSLGIVTINDISFSAQTIKVFFTATVPGGSGGGGGGGRIFTPPPSPPAVSGSLTIDIPNVSVRPGGEPVQFEIYVEWSGSGPVTVTAVQFSQHAEWFTINKQLPFRESISIAPGEPISPKIVTSIPVSVAVPLSVRGTSDLIDVSVTATDGRTTHTVSDDLQLVYPGNDELAMIAAFAIGATVIGAAVVRKVRRR